MDELNRVFEGDNVDGLIRINLIQNRCQCGGLTAAGCTSDQDQSGFLLGNLFENSRQTEASDGRDLALQLPHDNREMPLLAKNINTKPCFVIQRIAAVARTAGEIIVDQSAISL